MIRCLELYSGTKSVGKVCDALGWESVSVDLFLEADFKCDIMDFDYKQFSKDHFDIVWASPPCTFYSNLQNCWIGRKRKDGTLVSKEWIEEQRKESDKLIKKTFEIINYFNCEYWFLENPQRGQLKDREVVKDIPFYDVDYCKYSDWGYQKRTRIWTNKKDFKPLTCNKDCENMIITDTQKLHSERMGTSKTIEDNGKIIRVNTKKLREKYKDFPNIQAQHKKVLGNGYEIINGKKELCNTKELRKKQKKHKTDSSKDIGGGTDRLDRYRIPADLIFSLFLD